jgi:hypothetical protein
MAVLSQGTGFYELYHEGFGQHVVLYVLSNATSGDTFDVAGQFTFVKMAFMQGATVIGQTAVGTISGTVITVPAGLSNDSAYVLVQGCAKGLIA